MIVSINQPAYLPWMGYFERVASSELHIVLDHVQFEKNSMINRNKVRTVGGWTWLSVPVASKGKFGNLNINDLQISQNVNWQRKHWNTIQGSYSKSPFFKSYAEYLESIYVRDWERLFPLMDTLTSFFLNALSIDTKIVKSSDLEPKKTKSELILELCLKVGATTYLSGALGKTYLNVDEFREQGIQVKFQDYQHPTYKQMHQGFLPYMSVIDLLFNEGGNSYEILMEGSKII